MKHKKGIHKVFVLLTLLVFTLLPVATALEISDVRATGITDTSATIAWQTDEPADSFVNYGQQSSDPAAFRRVGDAGVTTSHEVILENLEPNQNYQFSVESNSDLEQVIEDVAGSLYSFSTLSPDDTPPPLTAEIPTAVAGNQITIIGRTEVGAEINIYVNEQLRSSTIVTTEEFSLTAFVVGNQVNQVRVEAVDPSGNVAEIVGQTISDTAGPVISLQELPTLTAENTIELQGTLSEPAEYEVFLNERSLNSGEGTEFQVTVRLEEGLNTIKVVATDAAGQQGEAEVTITADTKAPEVSITIERGTEFYDSRSTALSLSGGNDFSPRAQSTITGETEPGAAVFLYIYRPLQFEFEPDFATPRAAVYADENGKFVFEDVTFSDSLTTEVAESIQSGDGEALALRLAPEQVPSGLERVSIFPIEQVSEQQTFPYFVYVIARDQTGKTGFVEERITVHTCLSTDLAFSVTSLPEFQAPYRLVPQLLEDGRQEIQAVFNLEYQGTSQPRVDANGNEIDPAFRINGVSIEPACTQSLQDDDVFGIGCKLLPRDTNVVPNFDRTSIYKVWNLRASEQFTSRQDNFWDDFSDRQLVFPVKLTIRYQEQENVQTNAEFTTWSEQKVQTSCQDLGYFVDIPIDSSELSSILLADEQIKAVNATLNAIQDIKPFLEKAYLIAGVGCMGSFLARTIARWARIFTSKSESYLSTLKKGADTVASIGGGSSGSASGGTGSGGTATSGAGAGDTTTDDGPKPECPADQNALFLDSTLKSWHELLQHYGPDNSQVHHVPQTVIDAYKEDVGAGVADGFGDATKKISLNFNCPSTATAWQWEATIDQAYKWTCDRAFCREVPARWTEDKEKSAIQSVILRQQQCTVTGQGKPLFPIENCQQIKDAQLVQNVRVSETVEIQRTKSINRCWEDESGHIYYDPKDVRQLTAEEIEQRKQGFFELEYFTSRYDRTGTTLIPTDPENLLVYQPKGANNFIVAKASTCLEVCSQNNIREEFKADVASSWATPYQGTTAARGCYLEDVSSGNVVLRDKEKNLLGQKEGEAGQLSKKYSAGYTADCFIGPNPDGGRNPSLYQCVCTGQKIEQPSYESTDRSLREAIAKDKDSGTEEKWSYRQDRVFTESKNTKGTYYPESRYYDGRDFSGAFGLDYALDYVRDENEKQVATVDPHTQFLGRLQSVCLSGMLKDLQLLESMLQGYQGCLEEARVSGIQDAGMCKTWFTQNVCGLVYKAIAYASQELQCSPVTFQDQGKEEPFAIGQIVENGFDAIPQALETSVDDVKADYGNAQLNQYFAQGTQGFVQSMCLAALGYDFPLVSEDFLLDAAYSFPTATSAVIAPAERQLTSYNPERQTAIFNYEVGSVVFPGCRIRRWEMSLKCIGPEDLLAPSDQSASLTNPSSFISADNGVDTSCRGAGCDCLNLEGNIPPETARTRIIASGSNLPSGRMFSVPLESPYQIRDSSYRYDHVVLKLYLDSAEAGNEDKCFDTGFRQGNVGVYYAPIIDTSANTQLSCRVNTLDGKFICPELAAQFGFDETSITDPYVTCKDKNTGSWVDCQTQNLFLEGDTIDVRVHLNVGNEGACLQRTITGVPGLPEEIKTQIYENTPGPLTMQQTLGTVNPQLFGGSFYNLKRIDAQSNNRCTEPLIVTPNPNLASASAPYTFSYRRPVGSSGPDEVELFLPAGVNIQTSGLTRNANNILTRTTGGTRASIFTISEINAIDFNINGVVAKNILGNVRATDAQKQCTFQIVQDSFSSRGTNTRSINVNYQLLQKDANGGCLLATQPVRSRQGKSQHSQAIRVQQKVVEDVQTLGIVDDFNRQDYSSVIRKATLIIAKNQIDFADVEALFYSVTSFVLLNEPNANRDYKVEINELLDQFFNKVPSSSPPTIYQYPVTVTGQPNYQKIKTYMCAYDKSINAPAGKYATQC